MPTLCAAHASGQQLDEPHPSSIETASGRLWVYFKDKGFESGSKQQAIADLQHSFPPRAIARRQLRRSDPGLFDERDLPVCGEYLDALSLAAGEFGSSVHVRSRWMNAATVTNAPSLEARLRELAFVKDVVPVRGGRRASMTERELPSSPYAPRAFYGRAEPQLTQINLVTLHQQGVTGQGVIIGVLDTGFRRTHNAFNQPGHVLHVIAEHDFIDNDGNTGIDPGDDSEQHRHGTWILGTIGAYFPDELVGGAYDASFILCKTEDVTSETPVEEDNYVAGLEFIEFHGGDVATSSLSYIDWYTQADLDGATAVTTLAVNIATANGVHCLTAAGNSGHDDNPVTSTLGAPADAPRVITCGAVDLNGLIADFSSSGPSADGRVKPEVLARGVNTFTVSSSNNTGFPVLSGTSLSTPLVAAAVACLTGARPGWSVDRMRTAVMGTATDFAMTGNTDPLFIRGFGIINAAGALNGWCIADANGDFGVTIEDLLAYLAMFDAGLPAADVDDGSSSGTPDGGVTVEDLLYFLARFDAGC